MFIGKISFNVKRIYQQSVNKTNFFVNFFDKLILIR